MKNKKKIPLPEFTSFDRDTYLNMNPWAFRDHILKEANKALSYIKKARASCDLRQLLIDYGVFSRKMNVILREIIKMETDQNIAIHYKLSYAMWWNRTHLIETYRKGFFGQIADRKNINLGMKNINKWMDSGITPENMTKISPAFFDLIENLSTKKDTT
jgi:hypothetical protein